MKNDFENLFHKFSDQGMFRLFHALLDKFKTENT